MTALTIEEMIKAGGNVWEKNGMKRIYLNDSAIISLFDIDESGATKLKQTKPAKKTTYYCTSSESFYSANGMIIRNAIRCAVDTPVNKI